MTMKETTVNDVKIEHLGHASFRITHKDFSLYIDPYIKPEDKKKVELILVTHEHFDHCAAKNVHELLEDYGTVVAPGGCASQLSDLKLQTVKVGDEIDFDNVIVKTVEAHNVDKFRSPGKPFHPKGLGVGYVITINNVAIYHPGDTDLIEEMRNLGKIDVALLPIGGTYTMDYKEAAEAANAIKPKIVIPMHYNTEGVDNIKADVGEFKKLIDNDIEVAA